MRTTWNSFANNRILFGPGALDGLGHVVSRLQGNRVMIITDPVMESLGIADRARAAVRGEATIYAGGEVEPSTVAVSRCADSMRDFAPDVTVAIGGGSNMDLAKLTCATVTSGRSPEDLLGFDQVTGPIGPLICVPTTAGTGSESSASAVILNASDQMKAAALSPYLRPEVALVDPQLTLTCPPKLTAESGIDALTHAIEAYLAIDSTSFDEPESGLLAYEGSHPIGDLYAEKAIRLINRHFLTAVNDPRNMEARSGMALAATLAGLAFSNCGVALAHALEYPIGNRYKCAHGAGNGIVLPAVMRFLRPEREKRLSNIGAFLDAPASPEAAIESVIGLRKAAGLPKVLSEVGASVEDLPGLAATARSLERLMALSPIQPSEADLLGILEASL
ncbi:MAG: iron-containing alcohol dehydrogenase [Verrucomicrobiota bacterium]